MKDDYNPVRNGDIISKTDFQVVYQRDFQVISQTYFQIMSQSETEGMRPKNDGISGDTTGI